MTASVSTNLYEDLTWRGLIHQATDPENLPGWLASASRTVYAGFDPTADSLHVGHLVALMTLRRFQKAGHKPIALVGGATGMIGDPSGRSEERNLLTVDDLRANVVGMRGQIASLLDFEGPAAAQLVNNFDWMQNYSYLAFLRDVGKCFPVNVMLAKDSVKSRLERTDSGLSYTEFSYMLLQAFDFVHLFSEFGCELQIGGSDQWGNITAGIDLARRMRSVQLFGITSPLLTKKDGTKMGKTASGAIWLDPKLTSPYAFYQYWFNVDDADVSKCLRYFTELTHEEIASLDASREEKPGARESQRQLATEVTRLIHGDAGLAKAELASAVLFGKEIKDLSDADLLEIFADVPSATLSREELGSGELSLAHAMVQVGLAKSGSEATRKIKGGGAYINNKRVEDIKQKLTPEYLASETVIVLRSGKKDFGLLRFKG